MRTQRKRLSDVLRYICGAVFVLSGVLKSADSGAFARLLDAYGIPGLEYFAPVIVLTEILLGIVLLYGVCIRISSLTGIFMVAIFTVGYTYGLVGKDIYDCGCFGQNSILNVDPVWLYVRNTLLILMLLFVSHSRDESTVSKERIVNVLSVCVVVGCVASFSTGRSFRHIHADSVSPNNTSKALRDTPLGSFVKTSPDSTYLVFVFSYSCPHCLNSIANLNLYEKKGVVDKVIGIAAGDEDEYAEFVSRFSPEFTIMKSSERIGELTDEYPKAFYVRNDSLMVDFSGEMPCAEVLSAMIESAFGSVKSKKALNKGLSVNNG